MMITRVGYLLMLVLASTLTVRAADPELAGNWVGSIATGRGNMDIGLSLTVVDGRLTGTLKTAHGDWAVTAVTEKEGLWTVGFKGEDNEGRLVGRIKGATFAGDWKSAMADGTFELTRAKKR